MRNGTQRLGLALLVVGCGLACVHPATQGVEMPVHAVKVGGRSAVVKLQVPPDWRPLAPSESRSEYLGPDGRSRIYLRVNAADVDPKRCPKIARDYARDYVQSWGGPPKTRLVNRDVKGAEVLLELRRTEPKPAGEVIWGRVLCRDGVLAITSCTLPSQREEQLGSLCRTILDSLDIVPAGARRDS